MKMKEVSQMILLEVQRLNELVQEHGKQDPKYTFDALIDNKGKIKRDIQKIRADLTYLSNLAKNI